MNSLIGTAFVLLIGATAFADDSCFDLYMRPNSQDPGTVCLTYPGGLVENGKVKVTLYGYSTLDKFLIETFDATIGKPAFSPLLPTTYRVSGQGSLYLIAYEQLDGALNQFSFVFFSLRNLHDGYVQREIVDHNTDGGDRNSCHFHCH